METKGNGGEMATGGAPPGERAGSRTMGSQQKKGPCGEWQHALDFTLTRLQGHFYHAILTSQIASIFWRKSRERGRCLAMEELASGCRWDSRMGASALLTSMLSGHR